MNNAELIGRIETLAAEHGVGLRVSNPRAIYGGKEDRDTAPSGELILGTNRHTSTKDAVARISAVRNALAQADWMPADWKIAKKCQTSGYWHMGVFRVTAVSRKVVWA